MTSERNTEGISFGPRSLGELVRDHGGVAGESSERVVRRIVSPENAEGDDDLVVVTSIRGARAAAGRVSGVILCQREIAERCKEAHWIHDHAMWVVARLLRSVESDQPAGIDAHAFIDAGAVVHPSARVRRGAVVRAGVSIGPHVDIGEGAIIYGGVRIGARAVIGPLAVIGRPGFGFATGPNGALERVPQLGGVVVEADVEIGALCTVDGGTLSPTALRRGAKLDAHVHVAHNVEIGEGAFIAAQAGFAGSARLGPGVLVGGQAGVKDHARVGAGARIAAKSGVIGDVPPGAVVAGFPAVPRLTWLRAWAKLLRSGKRNDE